LESPLAFRVARGVIFDRWPSVHRQRNPQLPARAGGRAQIDVVGEAQLHHRILQVPLDTSCSIPSGRLATPF
jgi:hypothetical protein